MKKIPLPVVVLIVGLLVFVGGFLLLKNRNSSPSDVTSEDTSSLIEVAAGDRPIASLTPTDDGHWLNMHIDKISIPKAGIMDYELLYQLPDGRTQGVPGSVTLTGSAVDKKLLLGSESSGKFRYDEGVKSGTLSLKFRTAEGKLLVKFMTTFSLNSQNQELASSDAKFKVSLTKMPKGFVVVMDTFGYPGVLPGQLVSGPYGIFGSPSVALVGTVSFTSGATYGFSNNSWTKVATAQTLSSGVFVGI